MKSIPNETYGIIENLIATGILSVPTIMLYFFKFYGMSMLYSVVVLFLTTTALSHYRFNIFTEQNKKSTTYEVLKNDKKNLT